MSDVNYKMKYDALKSKFMNSVDMAFRLGYEQGGKDSEVQQAADAQQQQAEQESQGQPGQSSQPGNNFGQEQTNPSEDQPTSQSPADAQPQGGAPMQESEHPEGSELDQHINMLESMLSKGELTGDDLKKALHDVKSLKLSLAIKKNDKAVKNIAKALKNPKPLIFAWYNLYHVHRGY